MSRRQPRELRTSARTGITSVVMPSGRWLGQFGYSRPVRGLGRVAFMSERARTPQGATSDVWTTPPLRAVIDDFGDLVPVERMPLPVARWLP